MLSKHFLSCSKMAIADSICCSANHILAGDDYSQPALVARKVPETGGLRPITPPHEQECPDISPGEPAASIALISGGR
jgi:hypothetical protein